MDFVRASNVRMSFTAFARRAEDLIDWARPAGQWTDSGVIPPPWETRNVEEATFLGLEADLSVQGPLETRWTVGGMLLSVDSEEAHGFTSKYALRPLEEQLNVGVGRAFGDGVTLGVKLQRANRGGEDPYHRLDVRGGLKLGTTWVYLDANNLLNAEFQDITGALAPGRALYLGVEVGSGRGGGRD